MTCLSGHRLRMIFLIFLIQNQAWILSGHESLNFGFRVSLNQSLILVLLSLLVAAIQVWFLLS